MITLTRIRSARPLGGRADRRYRDRRRRCRWLSARPHSGKLLRDRAHAGRAAGPRCSHRPHRRGRGRLPGTGGACFARGCVAGAPGGVGVSLESDIYRSSSLRAYSFEVQHAARPGIPGTYCRAGCVNLPHGAGLRHARPGRWLSIAETASKPFAASPITSTSDSCRSNLTCGRDSERVVQRNEDLSHCSRRSSFPHGQPHLSASSRTHPTEPGTPSDCGAEVQRAELRPACSAPCPPQLCFHRALPSQTPGTPTDSGVDRHRSLPRHSFG